MDILQLLDNVNDLGNLNFGCRRDIDHLFGDGGGAYVSLAGFKEAEWHQFFTPCDAQLFTECESYSWCGNAEAARVRLGGSRIQLNAHEIWKKACDEFHNGERGGLHLTQSSKAAQMISICPRIPYQIVKRDVAHISDALQRGPVQIGVSVHDGMRPKNVSPTNGSIDENHMPKKAAGHALTICSAMVWNSVPLWFLHGSWGSDYGKDGITCATPQHIVSIMLANAISYTFPDSWADYEIPEEYILVRGGAT